MFYVNRRSSVLCCLLGTMVTLAGFIGLICYGFSRSSQRLDGILLTTADALPKVLERHGQACVLADIYSDDELYMPDLHERVVKGAVTLIVRWSDGSENVLLDWNGGAKFLKAVSEGDSVATAIPAECVECELEILENPESVRLVSEGNRVSATYCGKSYSLGGRAVKGSPTVVLRREYMHYGSRVALVYDKVKTSYYSGSNYKVSRITSYQTAKQRRATITGGTVMFILLIMIGVALFFVPERKYKG